MKGKKICVLCKPILHISIDDEADQKGKETAVWLSWGIEPKMEILTVMPSDEEQFRKFDVIRIHQW